MGLRSMTGYGVGESTSKGMLVAVELGSVNRKQLDVNLSLPRSLAPLEARCYEVIHKHFSRGRITGTVRISGRDGVDTMDVKINTGVARKYLREIRKTAEELRIERKDADMNFLLQLPDVISIRRYSDDPGAIWPVLERALSLAVKELAATRRTEGRELEKDISRRTEKLEEIVAAIEQRAPANRRQQKESLNRKMNDLGLRSSNDDSDVIRQLAAYAERFSVDEEIVRLKSHLKQFRSLLRSKPPVGKKMDFVCQELLREMNTIGSKASDTKICKLVIDCKAELDSVKEQVQNVE